MNPATPALPVEPKLPDLSSWTVAVQQHLLALDCLAPRARSFEASILMARFGDSLAMTMAMAFGRPAQA